MKELNDLLFLSPWFDGDSSDEGDSHDGGEFTEAGDTCVTEFRSKLSGWLCGDTGDAIDLLVSGSGSCGLMYRF